ncbi:hypothetical protein [Scytonema sp. PCC 10023]|uniref:hypothetical protein n=1 Tax=Scytonema sp. PCC 10023 TaxID=1680591 RepID=UPI0039C71690
MANKRDQALLEWIAKDKRNNDPIKWNRMLKGQQEIVREWLDVLTRPATTALALSVVLAKFRYFTKLYITLGQMYGALDEHGYELTISCGQASAKVKFMRLEPGTTKMSQRQLYRALAPIYRMRVWLD